MSISRILKKTLITLCIFSVSAVYTPLLTYGDTIQNQAIPNYTANTIIEKTNQQRAFKGLSSLATSSALSFAAQIKADHMANEGYFAHISPTGLSPWHWFTKAGYRYAYAGENLASGFWSLEELNDAWMGSPTHRANMLNGHYKEIGIGIAKTKRGGQTEWLVVQLFWTHQ